MSTMIIKLTEEEVIEAVERFVIKQFGLERREGVSNIKVVISVTVNQADRPNEITTYSVAVSAEIER